MSELVQSARSGELGPFQELFKKNNATKLFEQSRDEYNKSTALHMAAANGHTELLKYILENIEALQKKRIVNLPNDHGNTALHWACLTGALDSVKMLVEAGADPLLQNEGGKDSVYQAEESGSEEIVDYLLSKVDLDVEAEEEANDDKDDQDHQGGQTQTQTQQEASREPQNDKATNA